MNRKINESRSVANEFCKAYTRQFGVPASVIDVETENVDAIIDVGGNTVALELVSYRERDEYHEVEETDSQVKQRITMEKITAIRRPHLTVHSRSLNPCGVCWGTSFLARGSSCW